MAAVAACASPAAAQRAAAGPATAVQLPTFSFFSVDTTVSVPDSGSALLGGIGTAQEGRNQFGSPLLPFGNQSIGSSRSVSGAAVSVKIHDFDAMDAALLGESASAFAAHHRPGEATSVRSLAALAGHWSPAGQEAAPDPAGTAADLAARRVALRDTRAEEAEKFFARARAAEADGKTGIARIYYQMAARRASGSLKEQASARLQALGSTPAKLAENRSPAAP
jgi:hypothetical protein